jgi:hypothetical protein
MDLHGLRPTPDASHRKAMILNKIIIVRTLILAAMFDGLIGFGDVFKWQGYVRR